MAKTHTNTRIPGSLRCERRGRNEKSWVWQCLRNQRVLKSAGKSFWLRLILRCRTSKEARTKGGLRNRDDAENSPVLKTSLIATINYKWLHDKVIWINKYGARHSAASALTLLSLPCSLMVPVAPASNASACAETIVKSITKETITAIIWAHIQRR